MQWRSEVETLREGEEADASDLILEKTWKNGGDVHNPRKNRQVDLILGRMTY